MFPVCSSLSTQQRIKQLFAVLWLVFSGELTLNKCACVRVCGTCSRVHGEGMHTCLLTLLEARGRRLISCFITIPHCFFKTGSREPRAGLAFFLSLVPTIWGYHPPSVSTGVVGAELRSLYCALIHQVISLAPQMTL